MQFSNIFATTGNPDPFGGCYNTNNNSNVNGLNLLFNPFLFLNKFKEIEPEKPNFPKFTTPLAQLQLAPVVPPGPGPQSLDNPQLLQLACAIPPQSSTSSCSSVAATAPTPALQSKEFHDSLSNLLKRTMPSSTPGEQCSLLTRLYLCENPFEDFASIVENHLKANNSNSGGGTTMIPPMIAPLNDKWIDTSLTISALMGQERKIQNFFATTRVFREGFLEQFNSLGELLQFNGSLIANPEQYTDPCKIVSDESMYDMDSPLVGKHALLLMDLVTFIELFKMMSVFAMLEPEDQICLINNLAVVLLGFCERYHSARWKAETVVKLSNGFCPIFIFCKNGQFRGEEAIVDLVFRKAMKAFNRLQLSTEEYLLLRAIIMSHSAFSSLSVQAQRLLQREAERYAHALLQFLQAQHGEMAGAQRYAELLALVENTFHIALKHRRLHAHAARAQNGAGMRQVRDTFPAAFVPMCVEGQRQRRMDEEQSDPDH